MKKIINHISRQIYKLLKLKKKKKRQTTTTTHNFVIDILLFLPLYFFLSVENY